MDCVKLTLLGTQRTADTANLAGCLDSHPRSWELHCTRCFALYGTRSIRCFGQAATQAPHATHFSLSTTATPSTTWIASEFTCLHTGSETGTAVRTCLCTATRYNGCLRTVLDTMVLVLVLLSCRRYLYI